MIHTHIHTYTHTHIHTYTHTHIHTYTHTHIHTYTHAYIHKYIQDMLACAVGARIDIYPWASAAVPAPSGGGGEEGAGRGTEAGGGESGVGVQPGGGAVKKMGFRLSFKGHKRRLCVFVCVLVCLCVSLCL